MTSTAPARRRGSTSMSLRIMLTAGFVLALGAAVIVFVSPNDVLWLRLGIAAALWAALMSAFAVSRARRDAQAVAHREAEITRTYELELHREVTARREYESSLNEKVRDEVEQQNAQELKALRTQLDRLTDTLSSLLEGDVLVERLTLSAEATRMRGVTDSHRGRIAHANRAEIVGQRTDVDPDDDAIDAEVVEDDEVVAEPVGAVGTAGPRTEAPEAAWASRHRQHVQQAAATVAADAEARRRAESQDLERQAAIARERAVAEVDAQRRAQQEAADTLAREEADRVARETAERHEQEMREARELAAAERSAREAAEQAAQDSARAAQEAAEQAATERAARESAEQAAQEIRDREARAAVEHVTRERIAAEQAEAELAEARRTAAEKARDDRERAERERAEREGSERSRAEQAERQRVDQVGNAPGPQQTGGIPYSTFSVVARGPEPMPWPPGSPPAAPLPSPTPAPTDVPVDDRATEDGTDVPDDDEGSGGHASDGTRRSVAELLAALGDSGDSPRRRRRAED